MGREGTGGKSVPSGPDDENAERGSASLRIHIVLADQGDGEISRGKNIAHGILEEDRLNPRKRGKRIAALDRRPLHEGHQGEVREEDVGELRCRSV